MIIHPAKENFLANTTLSQGQKEKLLAERQRENQTLALLSPSGG
jgi:hypothetical protein